MFVPVHSRRVTGRKNPEVKPKPLLILFAAVGGVVAGIMSYVTRHGSGNGGDAESVVLGLVIGIGAAALGLALAVVIGRHGKV